MRETWAHWTYERDEWEQYLYGEWHLAKVRLGKLARYFGLAGVGSGLLIALIGGDYELGLGIGLAMAALFGGAIPGLVLLVAYRGLVSGLRAEPAVILGPEGALVGSRRVSLGMARSVKLSQGHPPVLRFELHGKSSFDGPPEVRIPVPAGREQEAAALRDRYRKQIRAM